MTKELGVRSTKLKLIYKKAIQTILDNKVELLKILEENQPVDSFFNSDASKSVIVREEINTIVEQRLAELKNELGELFKAKVDEYNLIPKLNELDFIISNNLCTSSDINDPFYIKEVYESNLAEQKVSFNEFVCGEMQKNKGLEEKAREEMDKLTEEIGLLREENKAKENRIDNLTNKIYNVLEQ